MDAIRNKGISCSPAFQQGDHRRADSGVIFAVWVMLCIVALDSQGGDNLPADPLLADHQNTMTIDQLKQWCAMPGPCDTPLPCEQKRVRIQAWLDPSNIWDRREYPWLPASKLLVHNADGTRNLEVQFTPEVASAELDQVAALRDAYSDSAVFSGKVGGFDMPAMANCQRGVFLIIDQPGSIDFTTQDEAIESGDPSSDPGMQSD